VVSIRVWSGLPYRSKQREILRTCCISVHPVLIYRTFDAPKIAVVTSGSKYFLSEILWVGPIHESQKTLQDYVIHEGFKNLDDLLQWFEMSRSKNQNSLPFFGEILQWEKNTNAN